MPASAFASDYGIKPLHMSAYGNAWIDDYSITNKPGAGDKLYLGIIPAGVRVERLRIQYGAATAGTVSLGFEPVDGDGPAADAAAFFAAGTSVATAGAVDSTANPVTFNSPVKLVATVGTAFTAGITFVAIVTGKVVGAP